MGFCKFHKIVLASASPRRLELLRQIGIEPEVIVSHVEEVVTSSVPGEVVMELSKQKAEDVAKDREAGTLVIGSDTVVAVDGKILGKPHDHKEAEEMIRSIEGRAHQVYTGVTLIRTGKDPKVITFAEKTDVHLYPMSDEEIYAYIATKDPMDKAGAYGIQGDFAIHVKGIEGDYYNVVGLPIGKVYQELKQLL